MTDACGLHWLSSGIKNGNPSGLLLTSESRDSGTNLRTRQSPARHDPTASDSGGLENLGPFMGQPLAETASIPSAAGTHRLAITALGAWTCRG